MTFRNADTHKNLASHFLHFFGGSPIIHMVHRVVLLLLLQQQQDELDDDGPLTLSPYVSEGRWRRDRRVPRPALRHPRLSPWTQLLHSANDQALITSCGIDFESFLTLLA